MSEKNKIFVTLVFVLFCFLGASSLYAQSEEKISIVTYYPSPYGSYRELTWGIAGSACGTLEDSEGGSITLGGNNGANPGRPYIAFVNSVGECGGYDVRLRLTGNDVLAVEGGSLSGELDACRWLNFAPNAGAPRTDCPANTMLATPAYSSPYRRVETGINTYTSLPITSGTFVCCQTGN